MPFCACVFWHIRLPVFNSHNGAGPAMAMKKKLAPQPHQRQFPIWNRQIGLRLTMLATFLLLVPLLYPTGQTLQYGDYYLGMVSDREIIAPFDFEINKSLDELERERLEARAQVSPCVFINERVTDRQMQEVQRFLILLQQAAQVATVHENVVIMNDSLRREFLTEYAVDLREHRWHHVLEMDPTTLNLYEDRLESILRDIISVGVLDRPRLFYGMDVELTVQRAEALEIQSVDDFYDQDEANSKLSERLRSIYTIQSDTVNVAYEILNKFLNPNVIYDEERTETQREEAVAQVPLARGFVLSGQRVVDAHEIVTDEIYQKIQSLRASIAEQNEQSSRLGKVGPYLWKMLFTAFLLAIFLYFLYSHRPAVFYNNKHLFLILLIFITEYLIAYIILTQLPQNQTWPQYLVPVAIASMLLTIMYDSAVASIGTIILSISIGSMFGLEFGITTYSLFCGVVAVAAVQKLRQRSQFFGASWYLLLTSFFSITTIEMLRSTSWGDIFSIFLRAGLPVCLVAPMVTWGVLYFFEWAFRITTNMTLMELSDLNKPLLRMLQMKAPGTYHHSLMVSNLAEQAAESISANSLLTRVGAYYHDIGKMVKPDYFTENQESGANPHDNLSPRMSSLVIAAHVREGMELARQYKLPEEIIDFIPEHHGTNRISFFYHLATQETDEKYLSEEDFRYPGPKPQSRETGILMLADSVEAVGRSMKSPTPAKIREMVRTLVENRFHDGELDYCDLTLRDITAIAESFAKTLSGLRHQRVEYPNQDEEQQKPERVEEPKD
jgi:cyclic-di-AMP phosphodiesterase PgpH